jgi:predicted RNase H-like HicB family nuclease
MRVGDYLRVPYIVTAESRPAPDGTWVRRVEHPELPDCSAEADSIVEALQRLDSRRVEVVLAMLADGRTPPARHAPMGEAQARRRAARAGFGDQADRAWDVEAAQFRPGAGDVGQVG